MRGWTRAGALARLFTAAPTLSHPLITVPERIIATKPTHDYLSHRELDTATPLARRLGVSIDEDFDHSQVEGLTQSILSDPRPTLVIWHHGSMRAVIERFPIINIDDVPQGWRSSKAT